jgi:4-amino-4-deoxy-L-arabinose transferase-like glycosyltransferase
VTPTRPRLLVALVALAAVVGWGITRLWDAFANRSLPVPWTVPLVMLLLAIALALWARGTRARLARKPGTTPMDPLVAARSAALAMAGSRTGALVGGFYLGVAIGLAPGWDVAFVRERVIISLLTALTSGLVVASALWLERVCRIPPSSDGDDKA